MKRSTRIQDNFNSAFVAGLQTLSNKSSFVKVYVESGEDKIFWGSVFGSCFPTIHFDISVHKKKDGTDECGKTSVLKAQLAYNILACIDADLDIVAKPCNHRFDIENNECIIHTQYYAIENVLLAKEGVVEYFLNQNEITKKVADYLNSVCPSDNSITNYDKILKDISKQLFELVAYQVYIYTNDIHISNPNHNQTFAERVKQLKECYCDNKLISECESIRALFLWNPSEEQQVKAKLNNCGYSDENAYKIFNGHILYALVKKRIHPIFDKAKGQFMKLQVSEKPSDQNFCYDFDGIYYKPLECIQSILPDNVFIQLAKWHDLFKIKNVS